jgi:hypothetical protein
MADKWLDLAKEAFNSSTDYAQANLRGDWDYSIRAFRNEHAKDSKYNSPEYASRSRIFYPKTRSVIRKNEAAGAVALFSNMETVNISAVNPDDQMNLAAAEALKEVIEWRLTHTIPAFQLVMGGIQDAQTQGMVCSYQYWEYQERGGRKIKDKPCIELRPIENIRIDAGAAWWDPVNTSPYLGDIIPMYVCDVKSMISSNDPKTGAPKWKKVTDEQMQAARPQAIEELRIQRQGNAQDPHKEQSPLKQFETVWVLRWFIKNDQGEDQVYYTLGTEALLTDPKPIEEVYFHGVRPYVMGYAILETHKAYKTSMPTLIRPLQQSTNALINSRHDNVQLVLNKRYYVARGRQVDVNSLVRNVAGGVTLMTDPKTDVIEANWPDVTSSSYVEQDRLAAAADDLAGNFTPSTKVANNAVNDTLGGSKMAAQGAGLMTDYLLRTVIETWWEPVLRQLVLLEQYYETDDVILGVCAKKAQLFPRFGISQINDDLLMKEVNVNVNVGMGASNPDQRMQKFLFANNAAMQIAMTAPPGFNVNEQIKEIYSNAGYRDGTRFYNPQGVDPRLLKAQQIIQELQGMVKGKQLELQSKQQIDIAQIQSSERIAMGQAQLDAYRIQGDLQIRAAEVEIEKQKLALEEVGKRVETEGAINEQQLKLAQLAHKVQEASIKLETTRTQAEGERVKLAGEIANQQMVQANEERTSKVASEVQQAMSEVGAEIAKIKETLPTIHGKTEEVKGQIDDLKNGLITLAGMVSNKKKMKGIAIQKKDGKKAAQVSFDDGSIEEVAVG